MFPEKRTDEGWTPFSIQRKPVQDARVVNPNEAVEISPIRIMSRNDKAVAQPVEKREEEETTTIADVDPKVSSVMDSVSDSEVDSNENGTSTTLDQMPIHPSSLPPDQETPVDAEKAPSQPPGLLIPVMNLG